MTAAAEVAPSESSTPSTLTARERRVLHPAQKILLLAGLGMILGSFLTWIVTSAGVSFGGFTGAGRFTFYAGVVGIGGGLIPSRTLAAIQAVGVAAAGLILPLWQVSHLVSKVGFSGWAPGTGLIMVAVSGAAAAYAAFGLVTSSA